MFRVYILKKINYIEAIHIHVLLLSNRNQYQFEKICLHNDIATTMLLLDCVINNLKSSMVNKETSIYCIRTKLKDTFYLSEMAGQTWQCFREKNIILRLVIFDQSVN